MPELRLICDPPAAGDWNMAVDEMMLDQVAASGEAILRLYTWQEPTLSLGYFQSLGDRQQHVASANCPLVRRSSGGGAILHDHELTYSIALPIEQRWPQQASRLYDVFHNSLVATFAQLSIDASLCPATTHLLGGEPFLCFQRRAKGDVLVAGHKIAGSAQRRRQKALLQHGSVLLTQSRAAPELPGLQELCGYKGTPSEFGKVWLEQLLTSLANLLSLRTNGTTVSNWTTAETEAANCHLDGRFRTNSWTERRVSR